MSRIEWDFNDSNINQLLRGPDGEVVSALREVAERTAAIARTLAPADTGALRGSIRTSYETSEREVNAYVYTNLDYAEYVHEGTGIYGPRGRPIRPRRGRYLVFPGRTGGMVFAREVQGQRPQPFLRRALERASPWPVSDTVVYT